MRKRNPVSWHPGYLCDHDFTAPLREGFGGNAWASTLPFARRAAHHHIFIVAGTTGTDQFLTRSGTTVSGPYRFAIFGGIGLNQSGNHQNLNDPHPGAGIAAAL